MDYSCIIENCPTRGHNVKLYRHCNKLKPQGVCFAHTGLETKYYKVMQVGGVSVGGWIPAILSPFGGWYSIVDTPIHILDEWSERRSGYGVIGDKLIEVCVCSQAANES